MYIRIIKVKTAKSVKNIRVKMRENRTTTINIFIFFKEISFTLEFNM